MLNKLRIAADNIIFRILLGIIVVAFALWGIGDVLRNNNDLDIVKFQDIPNIKLSEFYNTKKKLIKQIQQNSKEEITDDLLEQMNVDRQVISQLITKRLTEGWINMEKIVISDKLIADYIRIFPEFQDEGHHFSIKIFKNFIDSAYIPEEEFYQNVKYDIAQSMLKQSVINSTHTPKLMKDIIIDYLSQVKIANLIKVVLSDQGKLEHIKPKDEELKKFYEENNEIFRLPEERKINYIIVEKNSIKSENYDRISDQNLLKNLEDSVAGGATIAEISSQYKLVPKSFNGDTEIFTKNSFFSHIATQIFEMQEGELSYPIEGIDGKSYIIFEISSIKKGDIPELRNIKSNVVKLFTEKSYISANIEKLQKFESELETTDFNDLAKTYGYAISQIKIQKSSKDQNIPDELNEQLLTIKKGDTSPVISINNTAYVAKIIDSTTDKKYAETIRKNNLKEIDNNFKFAFLDTILGYIYKKNKPELKVELLDIKN